MNENVNFMLNLRRLIIALNNDRKLINALELKELLIKNVQYLPDSNETIVFIDALFMLCEEFNSLAVGEFYVSSCAFYEHIMDIPPKDIFFIGKESAYNDFIMQVSHFGHNISFYNCDHFIDIESLSEEIANSQFSILAYDFYGSEILLGKGVCKPFSHFYYEKRQPTRHQLHEDWAVFLTYQYKRFLEEKHKQVILGSSYSYRTLTDVNSVNSISFSLPGLDITSAMMFYNEIHQIQLSNKTIFCFGLYDFFKEIKKGNAEVYVNAHKAVMGFLDAKKSSPDLSRLPVTLDLTASVDVIVSSRYFSSANNEKQEDFPCERKIILALQEGINHPTRDPKLDGELQGLQAVSLHNKYVKYESSFELNCELMMGLKKNSEFLGKTIYFIIPPLPESYVKNINELMKNKVYNFLSGLESEFFHVCDFSSDKEFDYCDFHDGHHLNMHGAKKLRNKLHSAGILDSELL